MTYKYIWFDLGLTLVEVPSGILYQNVLAEFDIYKEQEEIKRAFYLTDKDFMRIYPHILGTSHTYFMPWYLGILNYHLGIKLDLEKNYQVFINKKKQMNYKWQLIPGTVEVLKELKSIGCHIGLISNWDNTCRDVLIENGLDILMDMIVISSEVGVEKPNPEIFRIALTNGAVTANQALYIGDNYYDDVKGAKAVGIKSILISPYGRLGIEEINHESVISSLKEVMNYIE